MLAVALQILSKGCPMVYYGDEVGMTGGNDPDCRRGMLWKEELQDQKMLAHYKKLLALRKSEPCIVNGTQKFLLTDDEKGLLIEERSIRDRGKTGRRVVIIYHNDNKMVEVPEYAGKYDLLGEKVFDGKVKGYEVKVLLGEGGKELLNK